VDFLECDLLIVMGTSLRVQPFAGLIHRVPKEVPRLLLNMEKVGEADPICLAMGIPPSGFMFSMKENRRDVYQLGDVQASCADLAEQLGWKVGGCGVSACATRCRAWNPCSLSLFRSNTPALFSARLFCSFSSSNLL
jgi:hypothetical protein